MGTIKIGKLIYAVICLVIIYFCCELLWRQGKG